MKILELTLYRCKRLFLANIHKIHILNARDISIIVGGNGEGKTYILRECSPLAANKANYESGGYKSIVISHNTNTYKIKSSFERSNKHSFVVEDQNGTVIEEHLEVNSKIHNELVYKHFGITDKIHELLIGGIKFTNMTPAERKYWFTLMSDTDYEYAMKVYNNIRQEHSETKATIKYNKSRLITETDKLLTPEEVADLQLKIYELKNDINALIEKKPNLDTSRDYKSIVANDLKTLKVQSKQYLKSRTKTLTLYNKIKRTAHSAMNLEDVRDKLSYFQHKKDSITTRVEEIDKVLNSQAVTTSLIKQKEIVEKYKSSIKKLGSGFNPMFDIENIQGAHTVLSNIQANVETIVSTLPTRDMRITKAMYDTVVSEARMVDTEALELIKQASTLESNILQTKEWIKNNELNCPKCKHRFIRNYKEGDLEKASETLESLYPKIDKLKSKQLSNALKIENYRELYDNYERYNAIEDSSLVLKSLWNYINENNLVLSNPSSITTVFNSARTELETKINISKQQEILDREQKILDDISAQDQNMLMSLEEERNKAESNLSDIQKDYNYLNRLYKSKNDYVKLQQALDAEQNNIRMNADGLIVKINNYVNHENLKIINDCIRELNLSLSTMESKLSVINTQNNLVKDIEEQLTGLVKKEKILNTLVSKLSPSDGLIAKGLLSFIDIFVLQLNKVVSKVWSYPLEVQIPDTEIQDKKIDLNYKFTVMINNDMSAPDISKLSSAQSEIIDIAFRIIASNYIGLSICPLFLDEPGVTMDRKHRESMYRTIGTLANTDMVSQIFLISHYSSLYGSLQDVGLTVLSEKHSDIPNGMLANEFSSIERL